MQKIIITHTEKNGTGNIDIAFIGEFSNMDLLKCFSALATTMRKNGITEDFIQAAAKIDMSKIK